MEYLDLESPRENEVLVRIAATGLCHTDIKALTGIRPVPMPIVLGHEGAGVVEQVGSRVSGVAPGDRVVLTFNSCGECPSCVSGHPAYCDSVVPLSFGGARTDGSTALKRDGSPVHSHFFGQSSLATHAIAFERNLVKVGREEPLEMLGPLGCGFQTGAGAVLNSLQAESGSSIAVFGAGSVGLSAVMAASIAGCDPIVAVDINPDRLEVAEEVGATHIILNRDPQAVRKQVLEAAHNGMNYSLDTTGNPAVTRQAVDCLQIRGTAGLIGGSSPGTDFSIEMNHLLLGRSVRGIVQGDSVPEVFIPRLIEYMQSRRFPIERLVRFYPLDEINQARVDMESGKAIKPVIRMDE
ncbi:MAG: NAD(P)-dependent alcohol dehydrogenase [Anaerolineales bacterium]|nr:NAD(P)-dependent alcohol dehydrogenase [Anaerolineales bacterium]